MYPYLPSKGEGPAQKVFLDFCARTLILNGTVIAQVNEYHVHDEGIM